MSKKNQILIIDDEVDICEQISGLLGDKGYSAKYSLTSEEGLKIYRKEKISLVILDIWLNDSKFDGFQTLERIKEINEIPPVIMISGHGNIETAVNSIKKGAYDFIEKPLDSDLLIFKVKKAVENFDLKNRINSFSKNKNSNFVAKSKASKNVANLLNKITKTDSSVLLSGLSGSGKEFLAKKIHYESNRYNKNFKIIDFDYDDTNILESEIFGNDNLNLEKTGVLEEINGGTIFFKNIDNMTMKIQGKLLRVLEEKKNFRIGGVSPKKVDFRTIASSRLSILEIRKNKILREDLLKKVNFFEIQVPNFDKRKDDLGDLIKEFFDEVFENNKIKKKNISEDAISFFKTMPYVKNLAQLKKFIDWSVFMLTENNRVTISKERINSLLKGFLNSDSILDDSSMFDEGLKIAREIFEKEYLVYNLKKFNNNISKMSENIGMERTALYRKIKQLKISMDK